MAIVKKKGRRYLYTKFTLCGIRIDESTKTNSRADAQEYEEKRRKDIRDSVLLGKQPSRIWQEAELRWLEEMKHKKSIGYDILHFEWLQNHLNGFYLHKITKDVIENLAKKKEAENVAPATVNRMLALLRSVLNRAWKKWEWISKVPHVQMRRENNKRLRWLTFSEANRLISELPKHLAVMAKFTLCTGLRARNITSLEWSQVDLVSKQIIIPAEKMKTGKPFGVPLNEDAISIIKSQIGQHSQYVFVYKQKPVGNCSTKAWHKALRRANIKDFRWHDLRHTFFSWLAQNGVSLQEIKELGGWSSHEMAYRYCHLSKNQLRAAVDRITEAKLGTQNLKLVTNDN